jgi:hypothetical protein
VSPMDPDKPRLRLRQFEDAPPWNELRREMVRFCQRSQRQLEAERRRFQRGTANWEIISGAIEYCTEVLPAIENAPDWESAWAGNSDAAGFIPLWGRRSKKFRAIGRPMMSKHVAMRVQTGQVRELDVPGDLPLVRSSS